MRSVEKRLRERIKELEARLIEVKEDRQGFRDSYAHLIREAIRIHGEGKYWNMSNLIERLAKDIGKRNWWMW